MRILNESISIANQNGTFKVPPGLYRGLILHFSGTNPATAITVSQLGDLLVKVNNNEFIDVSVEQLIELNKLYEGFPIFTSTNSSTLAVNLFLPFVMPFDKTNGVLVSEDMPVTVEWKGETEVTSVTGGTLKALAVQSFGVQGYYAKCKRQSIALTTSKQGIDLQGMRNIALVSLEDNNVKTIRLAKDGGKTIVFDLDVDQNLIRSISNYETSSDSYSTALAAAIRSSYSNDVNELQKAVSGENYKLTIAGQSAVTQDVFFWEYDFDPSRQVASQAFIGNEIAAARNVKKMKGFTREVNALS